MHIVSKRIKGPDIIILGAAKAGTTSVYAYLKQHPDIFVPSLKELNFFTDPSGDFSKYLDNFRGGENKITVEVSSDYLYSGPETAKRIKKYLPNVKLAAILRDPVERAYSDYCMDIRYGKALSSFPEALRGEIKTRYINQGLYFKQLMRYLAVFREDQIKIFLYEDLCSDPVGFMQDMFNYIGVSNSFFVPDVSIRWQKGAIPKNRLWEALLSQKNIIRFIIANILRVFMSLESRQKIRKILRNVNLRKKIPLDINTRKELLEYYKEDIVNLQKVIKRDLSDWLRV